MKFCSKCGAQLEDNAKFCAKCGNQIAQDTPSAGVTESAGSVPSADGEEPPVVEYEAGTEQGQNSAQAQSGSPTGTKPANRKNRLIGIVTTCVLAVIVLILVINLVSCIFGGGYETPIKKLCSGMENGNADEILEALPFDGVQDELSQFGLSMDSILDSLDRELADFHVDCVDYKITDKDKIDSDEYRSHISPSLLMFISSGDIDAMYEMTVELTVKIDGNKNTEDIDVVVAKINGDWKIVGGDVLDDVF